MIKRFSFLFLFLLVGEAAFANLNVSVAENLKVYHAIEQLTAFGLIDSAISNQRPLSWSEIERLTKESEANFDRVHGKKCEPRAAILMKQLKEQIPQKETSLTLKPFREFSTEYLYLDSPFRLAPNDAGGNHRMESWINPLTAYRGGRPFVDGQNFLFESLHKMYFKDWFSISGQPQLMGFRNAEKISKSDANFDHLYLRTEIKNVGVQFGRDFLNWGDSPEGGNLFTNNGRGLDMIKVGSIHPFQLPSFLKYLGKTQASFMFGILGGDREFPHPYISAYKFSFLPHRNFEWAITAALVSGGFGSPSAGLLNRGTDLFVGYIPNLYGGDSPVDSFASNRIGAFSFKLKIPKWRGTQFYYEVTLEDLNTDYRFFHEAFNRVGLFFPRITDDGSHSLRFEYKLSGFLPYRHQQYVSGWTHHRMILGDELGSDAQSLSALWHYQVNFNWHHKMKLVWETRDGDIYSVPSGAVPTKVTDSPKETRYRAESEWEWKSSDILSETLRLGYEYVDTFALDPFITKNNFLVGLKLTWHL